MKKADFFVILVILLISASISFFTVKTMHEGKNENKKVLITINGNVYKEFPLTKNIDKKIHIDSKFGHNTIVINNGKVFMDESDCKDKICIKKGEISIVGDSIICLPNRLIIKIISDENPGLDVILK